MNPFHHYKITLESGNTFQTEIRLGFEEASKYFLEMVRYYISEDFETGKETYDRIVEVKEVI